MFVASVSLPESLARRPRARTRPLPAMNAPALVACWLVAGIAALAFVPALRGGSTLGATLPFWLVVAPAIDLAWLLRAPLAAALRGAWTSRRATAMRRQAKRACFAQSAPRFDRSSRK